MIPRARLQQRREVPRRPVLGNRPATSRRGLLKAAIGTLGFALLGTAVYGRKAISDLAESAINPDYDISSVRVPGDFYVGGYEVRGWITYSKFDGGIYMMWPVTAIEGDMSPLGLVRRLHNHIGQEIDNHTVRRAADLFSIVNSNKREFESLPTGKVTIKAKIPATPYVIAGNRYLVPMATVYSSLDDIPGK